MREISKELYSPQLQYPLRIVEILLDQEREKWRRIPSSTDVLWNRKCGSCYNGTSWFISKKLQYHQAPRYNFTPSALVSTFRDPVGPESLGSLLLPIENLSRDVLGDMIRNVVSEHKRYGLTFLQVYMRHNTFTLHAWLLFFLEDNCWAWFRIIFTAIDCNI
jgi:hypothetical protein